MIETPKELPPEVEAALAEVEREVLRARSRQSMYAYLAIWLIAPFIPLLHVASWPLLACVFGQRDRDWRCSTGSTRGPRASRRGCSWSRTSR